MKMTKKKVKLHEEDKEKKLNSMKITKKKLFSVKRTKKKVKLHEKSAFTCHRGLFYNNVMLFGLTNAPGVIQELMSIVLQGQVDIF